ncbi:hypothetical protein DL768_006752 [Monosporascus sp. mg162]|nr:hypothetical protein DL768_006752 [Monosporascus sp. mg162]
MSVNPSRLPPQGSKGEAILKPTQATSHALPIGELIIISISGDDDDSSEEGVEDDWEDIETNDSDSDTRAGSDTNKDNSAVGHKSDCDMSGGRDIADAPAHNDATPFDDGRDCDAHIKCDPDDEADADASNDISVVGHASDCGTNDETDVTDAADAAADSDEGAVVENAVTNPSAL